jgi:hypothetical protein
MLPLAQLSTIDLNANGWEANNGRKTPQLQGPKEEIDLKNVMIVGGQEGHGEAGRCAPATAGGQFAPPV